YKGQLIVARFLLDNGANLSARDLNRNGWMSLHYAAAYGHKAMVEILLDRKADVQATDNEGQTALHLAARNGFKNIVEVLLAHGADVNAKTKSGSTPLHEAAASGSQAVAEMLLTHNADVNADAAMVGASVSGTALHI